MSEILAEAKRLHDLNFGVHWIKPGSKAPVKSGWADGTRETWEVLKREYRKGYGLGVRLGAASKIGDLYLANIDVDIKSPEERHQKEALDAVYKRFPGLDDAPVVKTGYGYRYFVLTKEPFPSGKLAASAETTVVFMPSAPINKQQERAVAEGRLTKAELAEGYRVRGAWEIEFMSRGKQVVLPPTIHPANRHATRLPDNPVAPARPRPRFGF